MKSLFVVAMAMLFFAACGDGSFFVDQSGNAGVLSTADNPAAKIFFVDQLWPLMKDTGAGGKGCAKSGCHNPYDNPYNTEQTAFKVDPTDADNSWNWAKVRRTAVQIGDYANNLSLTLKQQKDADHRVFPDWTATEKALIDTWTAQ